MEAPAATPSPVPLKAAFPLISDITEDGDSEPTTPPPPVTPVPLSEAEEQRRIDLILKKLFFSPKNHILSEGITFDATLRYGTFILHRPLQ